MTEEQYDVSQKMRDLFDRKQKQRQAAKDYWRKQLYNPYLQQRPFDPVLFRYTAMSAYAATYYKPSYKRRALVLFYLSPMLLVGWGINKCRTKRENEWRSGGVSYEDRQNKLLL